MKILIINQPLNNRGDESAHKALIRTICKRIPNVQIQVLFVGANPNSVTQFNVNINNVKYINLKPKKAFGKAIINGLKYNCPLIGYLHPTTREIIKIYNQADYILCAPGGICMGGFQNWTHLFFLKIAQYCKKPLIYYGRSFGPFPTATRNNRIFKKISLQMLHYFSFLSIRDKKTEMLAKELNINYTPTVDSAFLDSPKVTIPEEIQTAISTKQYIVLVPNLLIWHYAYKHISKNTILSFYSNIIDIVFEHYPKANIIMLPQTFNYNSYLGDDINFFNEIAKFKKDKRIIIIPDKYSSDIQQTIISGSTCLIGGRYHSIVFAINNNVPFISLSYEHKMIGLLQSVNKLEYSIDISNIFTSNNKIQEALQLIKDKLPILTKDSKPQKLAKEIASQCFLKFENLIQNKENEHID